jgi:DNA-binding SARP family transcriptional activator/tetratricopeptide (TPR) repeat protein
MCGLEVRVLGPFEVYRDGVPIAVEAPRERAVLAVLSLQAGRVVPANRLIELVWGDASPEQARATVHTLMWRLRRRLAEVGAGRVLVTRAPGYLLQIEPARVDVMRFEDLLRRGRTALAAGESQTAVGLLGEAVALWRGPPLVDVAAVGLRRVEGPRLGELHLQVVEGWVEAQLLLGRHTDVVCELRSLVTEHPLREGLSRQLMLALYQSGRQAEALEVYRGLRAVLAEELGVEPGQAVQRLHHAVLRADPTLNPPPLPPQPTRPPIADRPVGTAIGTAVRVPAQLPADVAAFTGRAGPLAQLDALLHEEDTGRATAVVLSAIAGTAGVGKTALAVHWAHRVRHQFSDGQLYVNLHGHAATPPMRPVEALSRFLRALGVPPEQVPVHVDEAADLYRTLLADRRMLVVLDNARDPDQVRPLLPGSPGCLVLVTSRDRLAGLVARDGARRLTLDVLTPAEAQSLLVRLIDPERVAADPGATAALAEECAHLPLALRIAAANLTGHPGQSVAGYTAQLRAGNRLAALAADADEQSAVRIAFDLSYTTLPPRAQRLFRWLGLTHGTDLTAEAAAALADISVPEAQRSLDRLAAAHLFSEHIPGRYTCHDLLRGYGRERSLAADTQPERQAALRRLFDFYLHTVDTAARSLYPEKLRLPLPTVATRPEPQLSFGDYAEALTWLDAERPNLVAAVQYAAEHGPRPMAWLLADALRGYFYLRMYTVDWLAVAHAALSAARTDGELKAQAAAHISLADLDWRHSLHRQATEHYVRALASCRETDWVEGQAAVLGNLGTVYWQLGRLATAAKHYREALALNRRAGWLEGQATNLVNLATVHWQLGELTESANHNTQAIALNRKVGSRTGEALALNNLGETYHMQGRLDQALDHLTRALNLYREIGNRGSEPEALRCLAAVHRDAGRLPQALELAHAALTLARDTGSRRHETHTRGTLAAIHHQLGHHQQAIEEYEHTLNLARDTNNRYAQAEAFLGLAAAHHQLGRVEQAVGYGRRALAAARKDGYRVPEGQALTALAATHLAQDNLDGAIDLAQQAAAVHNVTGHRLGLARALLVLSHALHRTGRTDRAASHLRQARTLFAGIGAPEGDQTRDLVPTDLEDATGRP